MPWAERWLALRKAAPVLILIVGVFAGLYSGIFTVNEAASVAAVLSFLCALLRRRMTWNSFFTACGRQRPQPACSISF